jgi:hypothetical protein
MPDLAPHFLCFATAEGNAWRPEHASDRSYHTGKLVNANPFLEVTNHSKPTLNLSLIRSPGLGGDCQIERSKHACPSRCLLTPSWAKD